MSLQMMDQQNMSTSHNFSEDLHFYEERHARFRKMDEMRTNYVGAERTHTRSVNTWTSMDPNSITNSNPNVQLSWDKNNSMLPHHENGLFSSSLSKMFSHKVNLSLNNECFDNSVDTVTSHHEEDEPFESLKEIEAQTIGNLLPDDDDLFDGVLDGIKCMAKPNREDGVEDLDFFKIAKRMELDDTLFIGKKNSEFFTNQIEQQIETNMSFSEKHSYKEYPSRTLFVKNINSNIEDLELHALFEQYGDIHTLYTTCKHRGFVMISYYDTRAAMNAMKALQNKPLRLRRLDIHYLIPKCVQNNASEKDVNHGTLAVYNLDPSVPYDEICQIFGAYGEIKEIQETPYKSDHKLIEFYDVRAADKALYALNQSVIARKKIRLEPSHPMGVQQGSMQPLPIDLEQEELDLYMRQSSICTGFRQCSTSSTSMESDIDYIRSTGRIYNQENSSTLGSSLEHPVCHEISSSVPNSLTSLLTHELSGNHVGLSKSRYSHSETKYDFRGMPTLNSCSPPRYNDGLAIEVSCNYNPNMFDKASSSSHKRAENFNLRRSSSSVEMCNGFTTASFTNGSPPRKHYMWNNINRRQPAFMWKNSSSLSNGFCTPQTQNSGHELPRPPSYMLNSILPMNQHEGSTPSINHSHNLGRRNSYPGGSPETTRFHHGPLGNMRLSRSSMHQLDFFSHNIIPHVGKNSLDLPFSSSNVGFHALQQRGMMYASRGHMNMVRSFEHHNEHARSRRLEIGSTQVDNKKQFELDLDRIRQGGDTRTTLMIKNIPNKYTSKMLMAAIDEQHRGTYDFIYLPIDFKNKCNVGYAFINMIDTSHIISFYETLNGKKWEKFNSEKVASLAYARIQGKASLVAHFQNSSLMNEDKRCRPIIFHNNGTNVGDQVPYPMGVSIQSKSSRSRSNNDDDNQEESLPNMSSNEEHSCDDSSSSSGKETD